MPLWVRGRQLLVVLVSGGPLLGPSLVSGEGVASYLGGGPWDHLVLGPWDPLVLGPWALNALLGIDICNVQLHHSSSMESQALPLPG